MWVGGQHRPSRPSVPLELGAEGAEPCRWAGPHSPCPSPVSPADAVLLNNIVQNFGMLDLVKKVLAGHKCQMDRSREQYARDLAGACSPCVLSQPCRMAASGGREGTWRCRRALMRRPPLREDSHLCRVPEALRRDSRRKQWNLERPPVCAWCGLLTAPCDRLPLRGPESECPCTGRRRGVGDRGLWTRSPGAGRAA